MSCQLTTPRPAIVLNSTEISHLLFPFDNQDLIAIVEKVLIRHDASLRRLLYSRHEQDKKQVLRTETYRDAVALTNACIVQSVQFKVPCDQDWHFYRRYLLTSGARLNNSHSNQAWITQFGTDFESQSLTLFADNLHHFNINRKLGSVPNLSYTKWFPSNAKMFTPAWWMQGRVDATLFHRPTPGKLVHTPVEFKARMNPNHRVQASELIQVLCQLHLTGADQAYLVESCCMVPDRNGKLAQTPSVRLTVHEVTRSSTIWNQWVFPRLTNIIYMINKLLENRHFAAAFGKCNRVDKFNFIQSCINDNLTSNGEITEISRQAFRRELKANCRMSTMIHTRKNT
jgi:hypothetical protein